MHLVKMVVCAVLAVLPATSFAADAYPSTVLVDTGKTITGEDIRYPSTGPAKVTALVVTIQPGTETVLHHHPAPMFAYMLEGDLTVDYGPAGKHDYHAGDAFVEAMDIPHKGINSGSQPVRILAVSMGAEGTANVSVDK